MKVTWATLKPDTTHDRVASPASGNSSSSTGTAMLVAVPTKETSSMAVAATARALLERETIAAA